MFGAVGLVGLWAAGRFLDRRPRDEAPSTGLPRVIIERFALEQGKVDEAITELDQALGHMRMLAQAMQRDVQPFWRHPVSRCAVQQRIGLRRQPLRVLGAEEVADHRAAHDHARAHREPLEDASEDEEAEGYYA